MRFSRFLYIAGPIFLVAVVIKATKVATTSGTQSGSQKLPLCPPVHTEVSGAVVQTNLLLVSTLDGQMTALDMDKSGAHLWSVATGPGPMLSSTISQVTFWSDTLYEHFELWVYHKWRHGLGGGGRRSHLKLSDVIYGRPLCNFYVCS